MKNKNCIAVLCLVLAVNVSANAQTIPAGYIQSPYGLIHKSCVHEVPHGAVVDSARNLLVNGKIQQTFGKCAYPALNIPGTSNQQDDSSFSPMSQAPGSHGWVTDTWINAVNVGGVAYFNFIYGHWYVPGVPATSGALIYMFNSMQSITPGYNAILQPVLQYGNNGLFGGNYWVLAGWYVDSAGQGYYSSRLNTSVNHEILGVVTQTNVNDWNVNIQDLTSATSVGIGFNITGPASVFNTAQQSVLEVFNITSCAQMPDGSSGSRYFFDNHVYQAGPSWSNETEVGKLTSNWSTNQNVVSPFSPSCNWGATLSQQSGYVNSTLRY